MSADQHFAQANVLIGQGRFGEAESRYRQALQLRPEFAEAWLNLAVALKAQGRLGEAEASCRQALQVRPAFVEALNNLGNILLAQGRPADAENAYRQALGLRPEHLEALINLARVLLAVGRPTDAETTSRRAVELRPDLPATHSGLGLCLLALERFADAGVCFRQALNRQPNQPETLNHLGNLHLRQGQLQDAEAFYRQALAIRPAFAEVHNNLGNCLQEQGRHVEAEASYRQALAIHPGYVAAHDHLGAALIAQGQTAAAEAAYRQALALHPGDVVALNNMAQIQLVAGKSGAALDLVMQALAYEDRPESQLLFMDCITRVQLTHIDPPIRATMLRALTVPWGQAGSLARVGAEMVKLGWRDAGFAAGDLGEVGALPATVWTVAVSDPLLFALLRAAPLRDPELEIFLARARRYWLATLSARTSPAAAGGSAGPAASTGTAELRRFFGALAEQCFINEYVYFVSDDETCRVAALRAAVEADLAAGRPVPADELLTLAAYLPLGALHNARRLLDHPAGDELVAVVRQQIVEPLREQALAAGIPALTPIDDAVSVRVQQQYAENPYPRWLSAEIALRPQGINEFIRARFPLAEITPLPVSGRLQLLVAGSGTGHQPIGAARRYRDVDVLAIDLSLPSLCYAKRKAEEMSLSNIEFAHADILKLGGLDRCFDVIESAGVLHHLRDIDEGLRILVARLKPCGYLQLGLYSRLARRNITRARTFIAEHGIGTSPDDIRRCRKTLSELAGDEDLRSVTRMGDFFSTSTCRDLLFHVQETCIDLLELKGLLARNGVRFLGFDLDGAVKQTYLRRFPDDPAAVDLDHWHAFEQDHPDTFIGMYQFWVQKKD